MKRALILAGGGARGAFQVGVLKFLEEKGWKPDMICGSSVGAINAAAIGSGMTASHLSHLWKNHKRQAIYKLTPQKFIMTFLGRRKFRPFADTRPMRAMLMKYVDAEALKRSRTHIIISAVNLETSRVTYFDQSDITVDHVMASAAMPLVFPYHFINGTPYWDGGIMANVPIMPALERGAEEVIAVLLSPVGLHSMPLPVTHAQFGELLLEHFLFSSYNALSNIRSFENVRIGTVAPSRMLGLRSLLNFSPQQAEKLIQEGYKNAGEQLKEFL